MLVVNASATFEATVEGFATGLAGTVGVRILDNIGGVTLTRTTAGISESPTGSGCYAVTLTAPAAAGQYTVFWDDGSTSPGHVAAEDMFVGTVTVSTVTSTGTLGGSLTLNYGQQRAAIYERRFPSSSPVPQWLAAAYADVWNAAQWTFKRVERETWYTTADGLAGGAATQTPKMPTAFARALAIYDQNGDELEQLPPHEFEQAYAPITGTGLPEAFCVVNRQVILGPAPDSAYVFQQSYRRRLATRTAAGAIQAGFYQADTDLPLWDDHHYILVLRAKLIGLRDRSDPTADDLDGEYVRLLAAMVDEYAERVRGVWAPAWP